MYVIPKQAPNRIAPHRIELQITCAIYIYNRVCDLVAEQHVMILHFIRTPMGGGDKRPPFIFDISKLKADIATKL